MNPALPLLLSLLLIRPLTAQDLPKDGFAPVLPSEARQGDALIGWISREGPARGNAGEAILRSPAGSVLQRSPVFHIPGGSSAGWDAFVLGFATDAVPGPYTVELPRADGTGERAVYTIQVKERIFVAEDIALSSDLSSLRTVTTPRKEEEARAYAAVLGRVDPSGVWLDDSFERPVAGERRTSFFGDKRRYLYATGGEANSVHAGIDFASPTGAPVKAAGRGRVVLAANREVTGNTVILEHFPGVYTIYMHMDSLAVQVGAVLERGTRIGTVGSTGLATGPHLHWELRVLGVACDPESPAFAAFSPGPKPEARQDR